jgi:hypothetical protein
MGVRAHEIQTHMKLKMIITFFAISAIISCKNSERTAKNDKSNKIEESSTTFNLSPKTKIFLKDYEAESKDNISAEFISKYNLRKIDTEYYFQGFATTNDQFVSEDFEKMGIKIGSKLGKQTTLTVPLNKLNDFLQLNAITYFEISIKTKLK